MPTGTFFSDFCSNTIRSFAEVDVPHLVDVSKLSVTHS